ncbi:MAG: TIGR02281 family clan AA aspartic protease [Enterobacterales bacterium]|nr:TIGR02281 family clan AA aspartic protease [Enterobacterales bacterium]
MGRGMYLIAWLFGIGLLTVLFSGLVERKVERQINPNQNPQSYMANGVTEVVLKQNRQGHYVTGGTINGTPVTFLLDTGATDVSVPEHIAKAVGMQQGRGIRVATANGVITAYESWISEVAIDNLIITDVDANINPAVKDDFILLGMSALKKVEFTQQGDTLTIRSYQ